MVASGSSPRLHWVDLVKVLGLLFIIYGHLFSYGYAYVFAFNVPVFFIVSGFLFKENQPGPVFWRKIWWQLVAPMLAMSLFYNAYLTINDLLHHRLELSRFWFPVKMLLGEQSCLATCWFIYTLIILKVLSQYVKRNVFRLLLALVFLVIAYLVAPFFWSHDLKNAAAGVLLSYPFFVMGHLVKVSCVTEKPLTWWKCILGIVLCGTLLFWIVQVNGPVFIYSFEYGKNLLLYLLGGAVGSSLLYFISRISDLPMKWVKTISIGAILVLGFHIYPIVFYRHFVDISPYDFIASIIILLLFIPFIRFCTAYVPWIVGNRK